jgi:hypothetical protein
MNRECRDVAFNEVSGAYRNVEIKDPIGSTGCAEAAGGAHAVISYLLGPSIALLEKPLMAGVESDPAGAQQLSELSARLLHGFLPVAHLEDLRNLL